LADLDAVDERVESDRASRVHADQVALDRGVNLGVELYAPNRDAVTCRVDDIAGTGCRATNCDSGPYLGIDSSSQRTDRCRSSGIGPEIITLH
jgi:hypothetical protein